MTASNAFIEWKKTYMKKSAKFCVSIEVRNKIMMTVFSSLDELFFEVQMISLVFYHLLKYVISAVGNC